MLSRPAGIWDELESMEQHGVARLMHLDRQVSRIEDGTERFRPVLVTSPAVAAEDEVVHHPGTVGFVPMATKDGIGPVRECAHGALRQRLCERAVDDVEDTNLNVGASAARGGILRIEEAFLARYRPD